MVKKAILVTSFGTSYEETRAKTIDAIERDIAEAYPDWEVRRAFTSRMIIRKLKERDGLQIAYITEAMDRLSDEGFDEVIIQPTHVMNGIEYEDVVCAVGEHIGDIDKFAVGEPLLSTSDDHDKVVRAIRDCLLPLTDDADLVLMGHGTEHYANASYSMLQLKLRLAGMDNVHITTVEGFPSFEDTLELMSNRVNRNVVLAPFMIVAGDHAINDMAGEEEGSLRMEFLSRGYSVRCVMQGLGEFTEFRRMFVDHVRDAMGAI